MESLENLVTLEIVTAVGHIRAATEDKAADTEQSFPDIDYNKNPKMILTKINLLQGDIKTVYHEEIDLKVATLNLQKKKQKFYVGKFPTKSKKYYSLVIREDRVPRVDPDSLELIEMTSRKYYEVCTNAKLCEYVKKLKIED